MAGEEDHPAILKEFKDAIAPLLTEQYLVDWCDDAWYVGHSYLSDHPQALPLSVPSRREHMWYVRPAAETIRGSMNLAKRSTIAALMVSEQA